MAPQKAMVPDRAALPASRVRVLPTSVASCSLQPPSRRASQARPAPRAGEPSDAALAAAAWEGWCQADALGLRSAATGERAEAARAADLGRAHLVTCGLWLARRRLVAAMLGPRGDARRVIRAALSDDARFGLVEYLAAAGAELVATEALARVDSDVGAGSPPWPNGVDRQRRPGGGAPPRRRDPRPSARRRAARAASRHPAPAQLDAPSRPPGPAAAPAPVITRATWMKPDEDKRSRQLAEVLRLHLTEGKGIKTIARQLKMHRRTVRKRLGVARSECKAGPPQPRSSILDPYHEEIPQGPRGLRRHPRPGRARPAARRGLPGRRHGGTGFG